MRLSTSQKWAFLSALAPVSLAATLRPPIPASIATTSESLSTVTSSYASTVTNVVPLTYSNLITETTCTASATTLGALSQCSEYVWSSAGMYYQERCDSTVTGSPIVTNAALNPYTHLANINQCWVYCSIFHGLCNNVAYKPAASSCAYLWNTGAQFVSASGYQAIASFTTDPCTITSTDVETSYMTQYSTTEVMTTYTVTLSVSSIPTSTPSDPSASIHSSSILSSVTASLSSSPSVSTPSSSHVLVGPSSMMSNPSSVSPHIRASSSARIVSVPVLQSQTHVRSAVPSSSISPSHSPIPSSVAGSDIQFSTPYPSSLASVTKSMPTSTPLLPSSLVHSGHPYPSSGPHFGSGPHSGNGTHSGSGRPSGNNNNNKDNGLPSGNNTGNGSQTGNGGSDQSGSSSIQEKFTASTVLSTRTATIIACPSTVTDCPASENTTFVTIETLVVSTTVCPVTAELRATTIASPGGNSGATQSSQSSQELTTSTIFSTRTATITACPSTVTKCPASGKTTFVTTETLVVSTTVCPVIEESHATTSASPGGNIGANQSSQSSQEELTTSTIFSTRITTITACPSSIPDCPASKKSTHVTTETIAVSTTVLPVAELVIATSTEHANSPGASSTSTTNYVDTGNEVEYHSSAPAFSTRVSTVTACPSAVVSCSASAQTVYVTTETFLVSPTSLPNGVEAVGNFAADTASTTLIASEPHHVGAVEITPGPISNNESSTDSYSNLDTADATTDISDSASVLQSVPANSLSYSSSSPVHPGSTKTATQYSGLHTSIALLKNSSSSVSSASMTTDAASALFTGEADIHRWSVTRLMGVVVLVIAAILL